MSASLLLILCACSRGGDADDGGTGTDQAPEEIVEQAPEPEEEIVLDLAFDPSIAPPLPDFVDYSTTEQDLRTQAVITVEHEIDSRRLTREGAEERLALIMEAWVAQMEVIHERYRRAMAAKEAIAAYELDEARVVHEWKTGNAAIDAAAIRRAREAELKQIRLISEATYRSLANIGRSPGCRYGVTPKTR